MSLATLPSPLAGHSIAASKTNGAGAAFAAPPGMHDYALQVVETGTVSGNTTTLEGTLNGTDWFVLATWTHGTQSSGDIVFTVDKPVVALRAVLGSYGGTGTVDAWISAANVG